MKKSKKQILEDLKRDFDGANSTHSSVMSRVEQSRDIYKAKNSRDPKAVSDVPNDAYKSSMKMKDVKRAVETSLPDITAPFLTTNDIVDFQPKEAGASAKAEALTKLINKQFNKGIDKIEFIETLAHNIQVDGTVVVKVGWGDDMPTLENIMLSELLLDPSARRMKDLRFAIQRRKVMISEIKNNTNWYGKHSDEVLRGLSPITTNEFDDENEYGYGRDDSFNFDDKVRDMVEVFEYYGVYDLEGNGTLVPILAIWVEETLLSLEPSPYPDHWNGIPFEAAVYKRRPFNIYGESLPELLDDYQKIRDGFMRGIMENANASTNAQTFMKKGGMDVVNKRKFINGARHIETNGAPSDIMEQGTFNEIPASIFGVMAQMKTEQEELAGVGSFNAGLDPRALNSGTSATAVNLTQDNSQKRVLQITRHIAEMLERAFSKWADLNMALLQNGTIKDGDDFIPLNGQMLDGQYDVTITAGTAGVKQIKLQSLNTMMQQVIPMAGELDPSLVPMMLAQMADLLEMPVLSEKLSQITDKVEEQMKQPEQPDPMQEMAVQMEMQGKQAQISKDQAKAQLDAAKAAETQVDTELATYGL